MNGEQIRRRRARLGMTQEQLAQELGTTQPTIARWEAGLMDLRYPTMVRKMLELAEQNPANAIENWDFYHINYVTGFAEVPPFQHEDAWHAYFTVENITRRRGRCPFSQDELDIMAARAIAHQWNGGPIGGVVL